MKAEVIEANLEGVLPVFVYGSTLLEMGLHRTTEEMTIQPGELYCVTPHGVWRVE